MSERLRRVCLAMMAVAIVASVYPTWAAGGGAVGAVVPAVMTAIATAATEGNDPP
jgi:uncharacterized membrane protein